MQTDDFKMKILREVLAENKQLTKDVAITFAVIASKAKYNSIIDYLEVKSKIKELPTCNNVLNGDWSNLPNGLRDVWNKKYMQSCTTVMCVY